MEYIQAVLLSLIEGVTEFLPISSTGHLILASKLLNITQTDFVKSFEIIIQLGAILAVVFLYFKTLIKNFYLWKQVAIAFIPSGILGFLFYGFVKTHLIGNGVIVIISLFVGGVFMLILDRFYGQERRKTKSIKELSPTQCVLVGLAQSVSMIPGVSRAFVTIFGGLFVGLNRKDAVEFSFFLAIPTMFAAAGLDLIKTKFIFAGNELGILLIGFVGSFVFALFAIRFLISFVQKHSFKPFAFYRIILALLFIWLS